MAWEFLTEVLHVPKDRLYVTYFGGNDKLGLAPDEDCRQIWLRTGYDAMIIVVKAGSGCVLLYIVKGKRFDGKD